MKDYRTNHGLHVPRHRQDDRPLAAEPDADRRGAGGRAAGWRCEYDVASVCIMPYYLQALRRDAARAARSRPARRSAFRTAGTRRPSRWPRPSRPWPTAARNWTWSSTSARCSAATGTTCATTSRAVIEVDARAGPEGEGDLRELLPEGRAEDPPLRDLRRAAAPTGSRPPPATAPAGRRIEDLKLMRKHVAAARAGQGGRRRPRSRRAAGSPRPRRHPRRRHAAPREMLDECKRRLGMA